MAAKKAEVVDIKPIDIQTVNFTIRGITPLIVHAWSDKAKRMILRPDNPTVGKKRNVKIPVNDFIESLYWLTDRPDLGDSDEEAEENWTNAVKGGAKFGFPVTGIKQSIITGSYRAGLDVKMSELRGLMLMYGSTDASTTDIAEIVGDTPVMREDMVRIGGQSRSADIRYRAEFSNWEIPVTMEYHADGKYTLSQIMNLINYGGRYCGIGEWRPEKDGQNGMYELVTE